MEAKGFGSDIPRSWARPSPFGARELLIIGIGGAIAAVAIAVAVSLGSWEFVLA
jgi:energy-coupling factor transport system permease protein